MIVLGQLVLICLLLVSASLWIAWFVMGRHARARDPRLVPVNKDNGRFNWPSVTICIPARDEEDDIGDCLENVLALDYPDFNVIMVNDRSSDRTAEIAEAIAARDGRLRVMHIEDLPDGWTGKTHALWRASKEATGEWLLFIDADTRHHPLNLKTTVREALVKEVSMVSIVCHYKSRSFLERLFAPLLGAMLFSVFYLHDVNHPRRAKAFANGQYILVRREAYDAVGGHEAVRGHILEDIALGYKIKRAGLGLRVAWGHAISEVHMFSNLKEMLHGWSRIYCGAFGIEIGFYLVALIGWFILWPVPWIGFGTGLYLMYYDSLSMFTLLQLALAAISVLFTLLTMWNSYRIGDLPGRWAVLSPIAALFLFIVLARSLWLIAIRKSVHWRGREYAIDPDNPFGVF